MNDCAKYSEEKQGSSTSSRYSAIEKSIPIINIKHTERTLLEDDVCKYFKKKQNKINSNIRSQGIFKANVDKSTTTTILNLTNNIKRCKNRVTSNVNDKSTIVTTSHLTKNIKYVNVE